MKTIFYSVALMLTVLLLSGCVTQTSDKAQITRMVQDHARAWETGNRTLLDSLLADNVTFAYPGRRLDKTQALEDLDYFAQNFNNTKVYIHQIIVDGDNVAVEWQFATTDLKTQKRQVVSDAIIAQVKDGRFTVWKEYLDGRVKTLQADGQLYLEEGEEPYPWPAKTPQYGKGS